jgi:hypothetical protein
VLLAMQLSVKHMPRLTYEKQKFAKAVNLWLRMSLYLNVILNVLLNSAEVLAVASVLAGVIHAVVVTVLRVAKTIELKLAPTLMDLLPTLKHVLADQVIVMHQVDCIVLLLPTDVKKIQFAPTLMDLLPTLKHVLADQIRSVIQQVVCTVLLLLTDVHQIHV